FNMKPRNKITFEYILIKGVNDSDDHARKLVKLLAPIRAKVNLIPFNEHPGSDFKRPSNNRVHAFLKILLDKDMTAIIRKSKGDDILAACGQLRAKLETDSSGS
ncbi:MAG: 23S rRNA (adenine(2503)-C(2))-methyltransferase RlmN, partial [Desulfobacterales bacterium]|nr:23S rRNA (adenine(2503)-C(2))-methyltransferase RlmN [Desulfobacterales bacterium]